MTRISKILLKHRILHAWPIVLLALIIYALANYLLGQEIVGLSISALGSALWIWWAFNYSSTGVTTEFWIHPMYKDELDQILQTEGFVLKCEENDNKLYFKQRKYWQIHHARIEHEGQHLILKVSDSYSERMESLITNEMLYGKKRRHIFSQNSKANVPSH